MNLNNYYEDKDIHVATIYYIEDITSAKRFINKFNMQYGYDLKWINNSNVDAEDIIYKKKLNADRCDIDINHLGFIITLNYKLGLYDNGYEKDEYIVY